MNKNRSLPLYLIIVITLFTWSMVRPVQAAVIHVTTPQDNVPGSLRAAITTANTNYENDTIYLPAGTYILAGEPGEDSNAGGDLDIDNPHKITIIGDGYATTIIDGSQIDRVLDILDGNLSITGVTIQDGKAGDGDYLMDGEDGGGIKNAGTLILQQCCVCDNTPGKGGKCYSGQWNEVAGNGGDGGGIYNSGTLILTECIIKNNITGSGGGGGLAQTGGESGSGGGIFNNGTITLTKCTVRDNKTYKGGEACWGGDAGPGGGIYVTSNGEANFTKCTINNNSTGNGGESGCAADIAGDGGSGGAIYNEGIIALTSCTLSSNTTGSGGITDGGPGFGNGGYGGAICNNGQGKTTLISCTITGNIAGYWEYVEYSGDGGGIYNNHYGDVYAKNTIIANNYVFYVDGEGPDFWGDLDSGGYNLIEDISHCYIYNITKGNTIGKDPLLGPLADNGGSTQTHALLPGSPAIDTGNSAGYNEDQRGMTRPIDIPGIANASDGADVGAYEFNPTYSISGTVTCGETGLANVTLTFSNSAGTTTTNNNGYYSHNVPLGWSGTVTPSKEGYMFTPANKSYTSVKAEKTHQDYTASAIIPPWILLNRNLLNFGVNQAGNHSPSQTFLISNSGGGILNWTISDNTSWLTCSPTSGTNSGEVTVSADASGLAAGTYNGTITVSAPNASNSPQYISVTMLVYKANTTGVPFGYFETPTDGASVYSSIPVTGWALDDIGVEHVKIYRQEGKNLVYIGTAVFVEGARPDVELAYPHYPNCYKAGWGYMMLTNFLPNGGNGMFKLHAIATDKEGHQVTLGTKTIYCDNAHAVKPFGAIDTPSQGGSAIGTNYRNQGWVLTPLPNKIPEDGHTIILWIDGVNRGHSIYNIYRKDIAVLFPGYANSNGAMAYFDFDTTAYKNGIHTIQWTAKDNAGNMDGIGSRYFSIQNTGGSAKRTAQSAEHTPAAFNVQPSIVDLNLSPVSPDYSSPIRIKKGYNQDIKPHNRFPDETGNITIEIKELERIEVQLFEGTGGLAPLSNAPLPDFPGPPSNNRMGFLVVGDQLRALPIGSTFNAQKGIFSWIPGPGFVGTYRFIFLEEQPGKEWSKTFITVNILPKFTGK
jgi:hypothetical protein